MSFSIDGAERHSRVLSTGEVRLLARLAEDRLGNGPGTRIAGDETLCRLLAAGSGIDRIARSKLGNYARPVRAVLFDKSADTNWALGWHQDRTVAVRTRIDTPGFGPWSTKAGLVHVEPPFELIESMVTLRAHLDPVDDDNAPLIVTPGSHRLGRISVDRIPDVVAQLGVACCLADAGDIWVYSTAIVHASEAARKPTRRRVLQVDYSSGSLPGGLEWLGVG